LTCAVHFDVPLRFPGQYFDVETGKHENWNRYFDPDTGRYLSPEPLLQNAEWVKKEARGSTPTYAYARNNPLKFIDPTGLAAECPGGNWFGGPMFLVEGSFGVAGGILFVGVYSCLSASVQVGVYSLCGYASVPGDFKKMTGHAAGAVSCGWARNTYDLDDFKGWSAGWFLSVGVGKSVTGFAEGHVVDNPDTFGFGFGPGLGFAMGPLACRTFAFEL
jgi:RHS repeat-associated protein